VNAEKGAHLGVWSVAIAHVPLMRKVKIKPKSRIPEEVLEKVP